MKRAFLSHSSVDREFVQAIAEELGRARSHIDLHSFKAGEDFRVEIRRTLDDSDIFVFFVSKASLSSLWCQFEIDEAELRRIRRQLRHALSIVIDDEIAINDLPEWLRRGKAIRCVSPGIAASRIEALIVAPEIDNRPFIGRSDDLQRGIRKLATSDPFPRLIVATGLEGVGRKTYLQHLLADGLDLEIGPYFVLSDTSTIEDLYFECRSASALLTRRDAEKDLAAFRTLDQANQAAEVAAQLQHLAKQDIAPCIVDRNSMLDSRRRYLDVYHDLFANFLEEPNVYLCVVHARTPDIRDLTFKPYVFERKLKALGFPDAQALIARLLRDIGVRPSPAELAVLGEQIAGYPPAAYYLASQIEDYGLDVVLADTKRLDEFHRGSFSGFLEGLKLTDDQEELLTYLSNETTLTLPGIAAAIDKTIDEAADLVRGLIDLNIVEAAGDEYVVSPPIQATVLRKKGGNLGRKWYEKAFSRLEAEFWVEDGSLPPISVVDATLRAGFRIGKNRLAGYGALVRPSLLISAAQEMYHATEYEQALKYIDRAEQMGGVTTALLEVKIKSLAHLGNFHEARDALKRYREFGERRKWYLDGFIERRAGRHDRACDKFQRGYAAGERSVSLLRDYADSLLKANAGEQASPIAMEALERSRGDVFILDLLARIAIAAKTKGEAEEALALLAEADTEKRFVLQRRAWFLILRQGNAEAGRQAASLAAEACKRRDAPIEAYLAWARGLIIAREFDQLSNVRDRLKKKKGPDSDRAVASLDLQEALEHGDWRRAEKSLRRSEHQKDVAVRIRIAELKSKDPAVLLEEREAAKREAQSLRKGPERFEDGAAEALITYE
jgi:hypothetical protein